MSATISAPRRRFQPLLALGRFLDIGLTSLGQTWLDAIDARIIRTGPEWDPGADELAEELRLTVALYCAGFH